MGANSKIEWTDASWSPIRTRCGERVGWHCEHVSEGCRNCYAEGMNRRLGTGRDFKPGELYREEKRGYRNGEVKLFLDEQMLLQPLRWKKPSRIFVCSMTDLFADFVPDEMIDQIFAVMALCPRHTFQVLTKRPARMRTYIGDPGLNGRKVAIDLERQRLGLEAPFDYAEWPLSNVWLGTSVENQDAADKRVPELLATPAAVRLVSVEPMLSSVDLKPWLVDGWRGFLSSYRDRDGARCADIDGLAVEGLDLVICGTESGPRARDCDLDHVRSLRDQCVGAGVPFFLKQLKIGGRLVKMPELDGKVWSEMP